MCAIASLDCRCPLAPPPSPLPLAAAAAATPQLEPGTCIIGGLDDIITLLDEHIVKTQTMSGSPFAKGIKDECDGWAHQLLYGQEMLDEWIKVQRTWM